MIDQAESTTKQTCSHSSGIQGQKCALFIFIKPAGFLVSIGVLGHDIDLGVRSRGGVACCHFGETLPASLSHCRRVEAHSSVGSHKMSRARGAGVNHPAVVVAHDHKIELGPS